MRVARLEQGHSSRGVGSEYILEMYFKGRVSRTY